ncbi:MAG: methyltransferase domain-containing protein [Candidatus Eremiobacteraeota bacterium]|nr:methyltransferase domain-containing protein [Candidatus Eremiobacteraeota bacterium]
MSCSEQVAYWNNEGGTRWKAAAERTAEIFVPVTQRVIDAAAPSPGERVLDIGCGTGRTVIELARRVGAEGRVVGLDVSSLLLSVAREKLAHAGITNAELLFADASTHNFGDERFELLFSQFGVMFFGDPTAAFANLRRALVKDGRIVFACWREMQANEWFWVPLEAAKRFAPAPPQVPPGAPGPLAFADPARVEQILTDAGFVDVQIQQHDESLVIGADLAAAASYAASIGPAGRVLADVDPKTKTDATTAIADAFRAYATPAGVRLSGSIWLVCARTQGSHSAATL